MDPIRVVLVDDHRIVRKELRSLLDPDPRFEVVGEAADGAQALRVVTQQEPTVVLLDLKLPDMSGIEVCERIVQAVPAMAVLILTAFVDQGLVDACLRAGARGYLLKDAENLDLAERLLAVVEGQAVWDTRAVQVLADHGHRLLTEMLNQREVEILRLVARGLTNKEIGRQLELGEKHVKGYLAGILVKMDVHHRVEAVLLAKEHGLI